MQLITFTPFPAAGSDFTRKKSKGGLLKIPLFALPRNEERQQAICEKRIARLIVHFQEINAFLLENTVPIRIKALAGAVAWIGEILPLISGKEMMGLANG